jgi:hypothetical protein
VLTYLTQDDAALSDEPVEELLGLRCFIDFYGPTDISRMNEEPSTMDHIGPDSPEGMLIGGRSVLENPDLVAPTIAMNHVPTDRVLQPLLMIHGSKDRAPRHRSRRSAVMAAGGDGYRRPLPGSTSERFDVGAAAGEAYPSYTRLNTDFLTARRLC